MMVRPLLSLLGLLLLAMPAVRAIDASAYRAVSRLIAEVADDLTCPVECSRPLVEATLIEAKAGTAVILNNWSGRPIPGLRVTLNVPAPANTVSLASGKPVKQLKEPGGTSYLLDLDVADTLILR